MRGWVEEQGEIHFPYDISDKGSESLGTCEVSTVVAPRELVSGKKEAFCHLVSAGVKYGCCKSGKWPSCLSQLHFMG